MLDLAVVCCFKCVTPLAAVAGAMRETVARHHKQVTRAVVGLAHTCSCIACRY